MSPESAVLAALALPLASALGIAMSHRRANQREAVSVVGAIALCVSVLMLLEPVLAGARPQVRLGAVVPGLDMAFRVEPLGLAFAVLASFLWIVTSIYSIGYMRANRERHQTRYYLCFALALASTIGIAFAANLFTLFIFYEALTLTTYPLVTHAGTDAAKKGGRTYLGLLLATSIGFLLLAIVWTWSLAGTLDFRAGGLLAERASAPVLGVLFFLYVYGIGKAALMPIHRWLPAAMVAPAPVSALLHAVAVVKAGVFTIVKVILYVFGADTLGGAAQGGWLVYVAGATIILASLVALRQDDLKRRLAYSTVSQLSYIVLAAAILAPASVVGAVVHIGAHAFGKITLFFAAGSIYTAAHKTKVSELDGIGRAMPWTMAAFAVGALSMIGVPPAAGFVSKWYIILGALDAGHVFALVVIVLSTLLNAAYFLPIVYAAFFRPARAGDAKLREAPLPIVAALMISAGGTLVLFFFPGPLLTLARVLVGTVM